MAAIENEKQLEITHKWITIFKKDVAIWTEELNSSTTNVDKKWALIKREAAESMVKELEVEILDYYEDHPQEVA